MYKKRTLYLIAAALVIEAVVILTLPSNRVPHAVRWLTAAVNLVAVVAVLFMARQEKS